jgi:diguanylate cyclase (GGDEF)-like protein
MRGRRRDISWLGRVALRRAYPAIGACLALGAPAGLVCVHALEQAALPAPAWLIAELRRDVVGYVYLTVSTMIVFTLLGAMLGAAADRLRALVMTDPLTGLFNRRYLDQRLIAELARADRDGGELALLVVDVDRLKEINDTLGHEGGDRALVSVAGALRSSLRASDVAARFGGDEFTVLCPSTSVATSSRLTQRLRASLDALTDGRVTVSIGVADLKGSRAATPEALFAAADCALYEAKAAGRDRVRLASACGAAAPRAS